MRSRPSSTRTRRPASTNRRAAASPATPAPTMMASYVLMRTGIILGWLGNGRLQLSVGDGLDRSGAGAHAAVRGHREPGPDPAPGEALHPRAARGPDRRPAALLRYQPRVLRHPDRHRGLGHVHRADHGPAIVLR